MARFISAASLKKEALQRRIERTLALPASAKRDAILESLYDGQIPTMKLKEGLDPKDIFKPGRMINGKVSEFATTGDYAAAWYTRQRFELDAGRDLAPVLYRSIYNVEVDASLPFLLDVNTIEPNGFVFTPVEEGGEMKFTQVGSGNYAIRLGRIAVGIEYTEELFLSNQFYRVANFERYAVIGHNAYANMIHFAPFLDTTFTGTNAFNGTTLTTFNQEDALPLKYERALEGAVTQMRAPGSTNRPGSYAILIGSGDAFTMERALTRVDQQGFSVQSPTLTQAISDVIVYDGWSGTRGKIEYEYEGVPSGTAYLIDLSRREIDFQSYWKWMLRLRQGDGDLSRNIEAQAFWDSYFGLYANPTAAVIKITLPVAASGA
jgi:hypothetical protein